MGSRHRAHSDYAAPYVEQFLRDVADGSGNLSSPYAVTTQYTDASGIAGNDSSLYGGGYDDATTYAAQRLHRHGHPPLLEGTRRLRRPSPTTSA